MLNESLGKPKITYGTNASSPAGQCDCGDCDCACAPVNRLRIEGIRPFEKYQLSPSTVVALEAGSEAFHGSVLQPGILALNHSASSLAHCFDSPRAVGDVASAYPQSWGDEAVLSALEKIISLGLLVPENYGLSLTQTFSTIAAWLHVTTACNLACGYCYLPRVATSTPLEVGRAAIDATFRSARIHGFKVVKLKYAGGEPLLRFPNIEDWHAHAQSLADRSGLELDGVVLSNGTLLTADMISAMQSMGLRLMISLDGLGDFHDCQRHFPDGHGSFDAVARSIEIALSHGLTPEISVTVSGRNATGLPELMNWILVRDLPFSLNFYRENDFSTSHVDLRLEEDRIIKSMLAAYEVIENNLPHRSLLASLVDRANLATPHLRTCAVGQNYLVFDPQGRVAKCQMDMGTAITDCIDPDPLSTIRASSDGIRNPKVNEKPECEECKWRYWCTGGCPLMAYRQTGRYETKSPNCEIYKALFPEAVRLEGLRLLKHADELDSVVTYQLVDQEVGIAPP
jgi:uncharacterized protein